MYSSQEVSVITEQFWTTFGMYLSPILSAEGEKINWVNYKTGEKDIRFIMIADTQSAKISITLLHKDVDLQLLYFDKFVQIKKIFYQAVAEEWQWYPTINDKYGKIISEIFISIDNVNILNKSDWPDIISFFKTRILLLDIFWCEYKYAFDRSFIQ